MHLHYLYFSNRCYFTLFHVTLISVPFSKTPVFKEPKKLIEEVEEMESYVPGDAERKLRGRRILDARRSLDDPPGGQALGRELAHYEKLVLEMSNETEITPARWRQDETAINENDRSKLHTNSE